MDRGGGPLDQLRYKVPQSGIQQLVSTHGGGGTLDQLRSKVPQSGIQQLVSTHGGGGTLDQLRSKVPQSGIQQLSLHTQGGGGGTLDQLRSKVPQSGIQQLVSTHGGGGYSGPTQTQSLSIWDTAISLHTRGGEGGTLDQLRSKVPQSGIKQLVSTHKGGGIFWTDSDPKSLNLGYSN